MMRPRVSSSNNPNGYWMRGLLGLTLCILVGTGCARAPSTQVSQAASAGPPPMIAEINNALTSAAAQNPLSSMDYRLGPEDLLQITLFNIPENDTGVTPRKTEARVSQEGKISLPLLGDVEVAGLTASALEQLLHGRYDQYLHNPQVGVYVKEYRSQQVSVMGAVRSPGMFQLTGPKTLVDLLTMAGGITDRSGNQVHIYRRGPEGRQTQVVDLLALATNPSLLNMPIEAGDVINVQQAGMFFVDGAVGKPGSFPLSQPYTITQALAVAGGVNRELASYSEVAIYRQRNGAEADRIPVDLSAIWDRTASDPQIQANDVVVVPMSTGKYIVYRFFGRIGLGSATGFVP